MTYTTRFIGIDISKSTLDLYVLPDEQSAGFANSAAGIAELLVFLNSLDGIDRIILEPTGGFRKALFDWFGRISGNDCIGATDLVTMAPDAIMAPSPMVTRGIIIARIPIHAPL